VPSNLEIKARVHDRSRLEARLQALCGAPAGHMRQEDVFFKCRNGRLKLRMENALASLIFYQRPDATGPNLSQYYVAPVHHPAELRAVLEAALGVLGAVVKTRILFEWRNTRVHLDRVEGLGDFIELETQVEEAGSRRAAEEESEELMARLKIQEDDLVQGAYHDLLCASDRSF